jgi:hypothetical protein
MEARKQKITAATDVETGEGPLPSLLTAFSLCPHMVERGKRALSGLFYKTTTNIA